MLGLNFIVVIDLFFSLGDDSRDSLLVTSIDRIRQSDEYFQKQFTSGSEVYILLK